MKDDLISRQAAIDAPEKFIKDCNPDHFVGNQKFIEFMDNAEIGSFGEWQFANGFNMGLTAAEVTIKDLPSAQRDPVKHGEWKPLPSELVSDDGLWGETRYACSNCGYERHVKYQFCPKCGAKIASTTKKAWRYRRRSSALE